MATKEQAVKDCLSIVKNELSAKVQVDKYFICNNENYEETHPQQMWHRLALSNAQAELDSSHGRRYAEEFEKTLSDYKFVPAGRILYGLGNPYVNVTLKNCYVIGIQEDSIQGIFQTAYQMAETYKAGGGCGIDLSPLRPRGMAVKNAARYSTGAASFMDFYSNITGLIGQKARIGALLLCIDVSHPDVEEFISMKGGKDLDLVRNANVSVKITDEFMQAVLDNHDFDLRWGGKVFKTVKARELWSKIIHYAWKRAEPGILFWDAACREIPAHNYSGFECLSTNPCGEVFLSHGDSCNLGSMNLGKYVMNSFEDAKFNYELLDYDVRMATRFLDNIITLEKAPMEFQQKANDDGRRLGLGIMGLADMFLRMKVKYDSDAALELTDKVMDRFMVASYDESCNLAEEKGPFPVFNAETHFKSKFIQRLPDNIQNRIKKKGIRNIAIHAIAPTGSLSCIAQCSSGGEPVFMMHHFRKTNLGTAKEVETHEVWHSVAKEYTDKFNVPFDRLPDYFVSAHQIAPEYRIKMQATLQQKIDQSISNTVNLPRETTEEQIGFYYMEAWRQGLKGITVYRDGSREGVLVATDKSKPADEITDVHAPKRPRVLDGKVHVIKPNGKAYTVFVGLLNGKVYEVFALDNASAGLVDGMSGKIFKENEVTDASSKAIYNFESGALLVRKLNRYEDSDASLVTRMMSTMCRHGVPLEITVEQVSKSKIGISSFARAISRALTLYVNPIEAKGRIKCRECGSRNIKFEGICRTCLDCGTNSCT